jgi:hypothetical protein
VLNSHAPRPQYEHPIPDLTFLKEDVPGRSIDAF